MALPAPASFAFAEDFAGGRIYVMDSLAGKASHRLIGFRLIFRSFAGKPALNLEASAGTSIYDGGHEKSK